MLKEILPPAVWEFVQDRVIAGVSKAQYRFVNSAQDEDSLTGALGQAIALDAPVTYQTIWENYAVSFER